MAADTIDQQILAHDARNASLLVHLQELGAALDVPRAIDCFFWAPSAAAAEQLKAVVIGRGLENVISGRATAGESVWNVQGEVTLRPDLMGSHGMTAQLVELAASCGAEYDGWGTRVSEAKPEPSGGAGGRTRR